MIRTRSRFFSMFAAALMVIGAASAAQAAVEEPSALRQCSACHSFDEGGPNKVGPNLYGIFGQKVMSADGFRYSKDAAAVAEANPDLVWNAETLDAYVADPAAFLTEHLGEKARSKMTFKLTKPEQRAEVVAYFEAVAAEANGDTGEEPGEEAGDETPAASEDASAAESAPAPQ